MSDTITLAMEDAVDLIRRAFAATGVTDAVAFSVATALVAAEAEGQVGHGFTRVADYVAQVKSGKINSKADIRVHFPGAASLLIDADCGFAYPAMDAALDAGIPIAQEAGIAIMGIGNSHHCGALSVQVERIAKAGLIGLMVANAPKAMAPWGGSQPLFGTNPIAFAAPNEGAPLVIDLSLSRVARGKVMAAHKAGKDIPLGWALDPDGNPTTDTQAALDGTMVPIGEAKGTALALMVEILAAGLTGSAFSYEASSFFAAEGAPPRVGQTLIAIRPDPSTDFAARLSQLLGEITTMPGARLPGTRRQAAISRAVEHGIDVPRRLFEGVRSIADTRA